MSGSKQINISENIYNSLKARQHPGQSISGVIEELFHEIEELKLKLDEKQQLENKNGENVND